MEIITVWHTRLQLMTAAFLFSPPKHTRSLKCARLYLMKRQDCNLLPFYLFSPFDEARPIKVTSRLHRHHVETATDQPSGGLEDLILST